MKKTGMEIKEAEGVGVHPVLREGSWNRLSLHKSQLYT